MCRFLLVRKSEEFSIGSFLELFAAKCRESQEWQGDGWGICWLNEHGKWRSLKSLNPIWTERSRFQDLPQSTTFVVHARSSSFKLHKNNLEFNQPFVSDDIAFVFNGLVKGVKNLNVSGHIGAQKLFNLFLQAYCFSKDVREILSNIKTLMLKCSSHVVALNIAVCDKKNFFSLCFFSEQEDYYTVYFAAKPCVVICSEVLDGFNFYPVRNGEVLVI